MPNVVVTGATGFIGRHLSPRLRSAGHQAVELNSTFGDIADPDTWSRVPAAGVVVHLAGRTFVPDSWSDPGGYMRCNMLGTVAALDYCRTHRARLVFLSSYLYGNALTQPIREDAPLGANNPYGLSKLLAEDACRFYAQRFNVPVAILRPFNVYGPGQGDGFLLPHIISQVRKGDEVRVKDLRPKRDYVHVGDVVEAIISCLDLKAHFGVFNIGTGKSHSVSQVIQITQRISGTNLPVRTSDEIRPDEIMDTIADISLARAVLGWEPRWELEAGIASLCNGGTQ